MADGEYDLVAQAAQALGNGASLKVRHVTVKGADVTGVELAVKALASIIRTRDPGNFHCAGMQKQAPTAAL